MKKILALILLTISTQLYADTEPAPWVGADFDKLKCVGPNQSQGGYGPYDFVSQHDKVPIVEQFHFAPHVEQLIRPMQGSFPGDFDYTLRAIPNHHRALLALIKFQLQMNAKLRTKQKLERPVECYLQRAINFRNHDPVPYTLYAYYLHKAGRNDQVGMLYEKALLLSPNSAKIQYSYALFLMDTKNYDKAYDVAKKLYQDDKRAPVALKNKLIKLNIWK